MHSHWKEQDIQVEGVQLHYTRTGEGDKPPLIFVHGFSDNGRCWTPVAQELEHHYDIIMPDMRGHGRSQRVQAEDTVDMVADVAGLIETLGIRHPIVVGHSMGAMISFQLAVRYPERVKALVLEDPPWQLSWPEEFLNGKEHPIATWAKSLPSTPLSELISGYRRDHPTWSEEFIHIMAESKKQLDPHIADIMIQKRFIMGNDWIKDLPLLKIPVLLFTGNPSLGGIVTAEVTEKVRQLNPQVRIVTINDTGHLIRFDRFDVFMKELKTFLGELPA